MRTEVLSEHPDLMLAGIERERRRGAVEQLARVESLREERRKARSEGRWLAWLRLAIAVSGVKREATRQHLVSALPTAREQTILAGRNAERRVADELAAALDDEWLLLRGPATRLTPGAARTSSVSSAATTNSTRPSALAREPCSTLSR